MDKENNEGNKTRGKETFIFGSWKCRKKRVRSEDLSSCNFDREKSLYGKKEVKPQLNKQNSICSSTSAYNSCTTDEKNETIVTKRAVSVYDQLHEQDFHCPRCSSKMEEPRLLPCLHSVCSNCVNDFMGKDYNGPSRVVRDGGSDGFQLYRRIEGCPKCQFPLPKYGLPVPPPHYTLQHRLVIHAVRRRLSQRAICCDMCPDEVQATHHCPSCLCNLCEDCGSEHEHEVRPLWEARRIRRVAVCGQHPAHPLRFQCVACQQPVCKECVWRPSGAHRGHATEDAASAGAQAQAHLSAALARARGLLSSLLTGDELLRSRNVFHLAQHDTVPSTCHLRSRSSISSHSREARERIQEFSRLKRARYLIDAIFIVEDLLANGSDVEILSLKRIVLKRLKFLGVTTDWQSGFINSTSKNALQQHRGVYHCCTFCSSGGKKEATCSCNGTMPGGYKGCGHGHPGHPGVHHWSCCGSTYHDGVCLFPRKCTFKITL